MKAMKKVTVHGNIVIVPKVSRFSSFGAGSILVFSSAAPRLIYSDLPNAALQRHYRFPSAEVRVHKLQKAKQEL